MAKTYIALENIRHNGKRYAPNDDIELDNKAAKQLLELNAVKAKVVSKAAQDEAEAKAKAEAEAAETEAKAKAEAEAAETEAKANTGKGKAKAK